MHIKEIYKFFHSLLFGWNVNTVNECWCLASMAPYETCLHAGVFWRAFVNSPVLIDQLSYKKRSSWSGGADTHEYMQGLESAR